MKELLQMLKDCLESDLPLPSKSGEPGHVSGESIEHAVSRQSLKGQDLAALKISDVFAAEQRLRSLFGPSPLISPAALNIRLGHAVWLKAESLLPTGAFKIRGACNKICTLVEKHGPDIAVVTASSGNHGIAVAYAARQTGVKASVVVPVQAPQAKKDLIRSLGASLIEHGPTYNESFPEACRQSAQTGAYYVHSVADAQVIAGQGTISLELFSQLSAVEQIIIPLGGGGLSSGMAFTAKMLRPDIRIVCVMAKGSDVYAACRRAGHVVALDHVASIADAVLTRTVEDYLYPYVEQYVDTIVTVQEQSIMAAVKVAALDGKLVLEGAGALGLAAILEDQVDLSLKSAIICSGSNIDGSVLQKCLA